ncbi:hypothetical protein CASFOL_020183 [Castilleja foliolosa]|uniref:Uncharacterized protein n=1 Tax=Castilleja foliolosa TaxID=1961234 RepID=A0ABD3D3P2_9LAMI
MARDPIAMGLYSLVLVVCAPLWEEIVGVGVYLEEPCFSHRGYPRELRGIEV